MSIYKIYLAVNEIWAVIVSPQLRLLFFKVYSMSIYKIYLVMNEI